MVDERQQVMADRHPVADYLERTAGLGIEPAAALVMAPRGELDLKRAFNDAVLRLCEEHGGFFFPVCSVHPAEGAAALDELDRVAAAGSRWLQLHPKTQDRPSRNLIAAGEATAMLNAWLATRTRRRKRSASSSSIPPIRWLSPA
jgi:predicted TIM-barrel fold metal-dependent hydrolase